MGEHGAPGSNLSDSRWAWEEGVFCTLYIGHTFVKTVFWNKIFFFIKLPVRLLDGEPWVTGITRAGSILFLSSRRGGCCNV